MNSPSSPRRDLTPESAAPTDIAPLGRTGQTPSHERTAEDDIDLANWSAIAADPGFRDLLKKKARFIIPATIFFVVYYFALPIGVGWFPRFMETRVLGDVNIAYLFALSQFFMAWILAFVYVGAALNWDRKAAEILSRFGKGGAR